MGRKEYQADDIDPAILPLVDVLNELEHVETAVSCEGHENQWWSSRRPVVTFFVKVPADRWGRLPLSSGCATPTQRPRLDPPPNVSRGVSLNT